MNHIRSMREYAEVLELIREIQEIDAEVDWNLEHRILPLTTLQFIEAP